MTAAELTRALGAFLEWAAVGAVLVPAACALSGLLATGWMVVRFWRERVVTRQPHELPPVPLRGRQ